MISSVFASALNGMQTNQRSLARHAERIADWGTSSAPGDVSLEHELVGVMQSRHGYEANLAVARAADDMLGSLIDVLA